MATQQLDLAKIKEIGRRTDASVNDIFLTLCGAALRRYLLDCDALPTRSLIAGVPVNLREEGQEGGNAVGYLWAVLDTELADPIERLEAVKKSMTAAKDHLRSMSPSVRSTFTMATMGSTIVTLLSGQGARLHPSMNVTISNVPGPKSRLYLNGAPMEAFYPISLAFQGLGLNITCISYDNRLNIGVVGAATVCRTYSTSPSTWPKPWTSSTLRRPRWPISRVERHFSRYGWACEHRAADRQVRADHARGRAARR